jgi:hypothetical protein
MRAFLYILTLLFFAGYVNAEGYYCPYRELGSFGNNVLLYDYYDVFNGYWMRSGETGWQTIESYCRAKGDTSIHSDAGEWKCNDSRGMCAWAGGRCDVVRSRQPDCKALCEAVLRDEGPSCLGNCPDGKQSNYLYEMYNCPPSFATPTKATPAPVFTSRPRIVTVTVTIPSKTRSVNPPAKTNHPTNTNYNRIIYRVVNQQNTSEDDCD